MEKLLFHQNFRVKVFGGFCLGSPETQKSDFQSIACLCVDVNRATYYTPGPIFMEFGM